MSYKFAGALIDNRNDAVAYVAEEYVSAGGMNTPEQIAEWLADPSFADQCAAEILEGWDCNIATTGSDPDYPSHAELADAIRDLKASDFE